MDKITSRASFLIRLTFLPIIFLTTPSCSSIHVVGITNNTTETIQFRGQFEYKPHPSYNMDFTLQPGANNAWMYEIGFFEKEILDKDLKRIILTNDKGCKIVVERDTLEKIVVKDGPWEITIDQKMMACD
ncbi:MAG: hypothetical protein L3J98_15270 [Gammaproteobacteria bacterium]|nr:hypothetical protein [Gammaproteobacteria bacterium]MCF6261499.1 hypothetical protein [Gammaproteobacteria bacterium]